MQRQVQEGCLGVGAAGLGDAGHQPELVDASGRDHAEHQRDLDEQEETVTRAPQLPDAADVLPAHPQSGGEHGADADQGHEAEAAPQVRPQRAGALAESAAGRGEHGEDHQAADPHSAAHDVDLVAYEVDHLLRVLGCGGGYGRDERHRKREGEGGESEGAEVSSNAGEEERDQRRGRQYQDDVLHDVDRSLSHPRALRRGCAQQDPDVPRRERLAEWHALPGPGHAAGELEVAGHQQHDPGPRQVRRRPPTQHVDVTLLVPRRAQCRADCRRVRHCGADGPAQAREIARFRENQPERGRGVAGRGGQVNEIHER